MKIITTIVWLLLVSIPLAAEPIVVKSFEVPWGSSGSMCLHSNGLLAVGGESVTVWDSSTGLRKLQLQLRARVLFSPDGQDLLAYQGSRGEIYRISDGKLKCRLQVKPSENIGVAAWADGVLVSADTREQTGVKLWDPGSGKAKGSFEVGSGANDLAVSPDGRYLFAGEQYGRLLISEVSSRRLLAQIKHLMPDPEDRVQVRTTALAVSPDGKAVVAGGDITGQLVIYRAPLWKPSPRLSRTDLIYRAGFVAEGRQLAMLYGGTVEVVDVHRFKQVYERPGDFTDMAIAPTGDRMALVDSKGTLTVLSFK